MPFATTQDGLRLFYRFDGPEDAPVLVLANSLGTDHHVWDGLIPNLTSRYRVLRYDARGHGQSDAPPGEYKMEVVARDVLDILDHAGVDKVRYAGLSWGGAAGQWLAANAPERFERLVLANSGAFFGTPEIWQGRMDAVRKGGLEAIAEPTMERWFTEGFRKAHPDQVEAVKQLLLQTPVEGYASSCAALRDTDFRPYLPRITVPTLVIGGLHDTASPPERSGELADTIPGARLVMLDCAHMALVEQRQQFEAVMIGFLE
jgi:3-oxoadipate enol-lactonase